MGIKVGFLVYFSYNAYRYLKVVFITGISVSIFYFVTSVGMSGVKNTIQKDELYKNGNFIVSAYEFIIPNGERAGSALNLIELKTVKKKWSEEIKSYYDQNQYITITEEQLIDLLKTVKM